MRNVERYSTNDDNGVDEGMVYLLVCNSILLYSSANATLSHQSSSPFDQASCN